VCKKLQKVTYTPNKMEGFRASHTYCPKCYIKIMEEQINTIDKRKENDINTKYNRREEDK
jgi:hypothetical protein